MKVPKIMYINEIFDNTFHRTAIGVEEVEIGDSFNLMNFTLPSEDAAFGCDVYKFYKDVFNQYFSEKSPEEKKSELIKFSHNCINGSIHLLEGAKEPFKVQKDYYTQMYKESKLKDALTGKELDESGIERVVNKELQISMSEYMWQPIRRIGIILSTHPEIKEELAPKIRDAISYYEAKSNDFNLDHWMMNYSIDVAQYLKKQIE